MKDWLMKDWLMKDWFVIVLLIFAIIGFVAGNSVASSICIIMSQLYIMDAKLDRLIKKKEKLSHGQKERKT